MDATNTPATSQSLTGVRIAVVEDDHRLRQDLVDFLIWRGARAWGAASAEAFWARLVTGEHPDLTVLDLGLPGESGLSLAGRLRQRLPDSGILMLTAFGHDTDRIAGLDGGADAYLVKGASLELLEATCRSLLRRAPPPAAARSPAIDVVPATAWQLQPLQARLQTPLGRDVRLTHLEQVFLDRLMRTPGVAVSRSELLAHMGKRDTLEQLRNLDGCAARLRRKLASLGAEELPVRSYYGQGYAFGAPAVVSMG